MNTKLTVGLTDTHDHVHVSLGDEHADYQPRRALSISLNILDRCASDHKDGYVQHGLPAITPAHIPVNAALALARGLAEAADQIIDDVEIDL